jgi:mono/diheme cytochrome c family protein
MKRMISMVAGLSSVMTALAFAGPAGARPPGARLRASCLEASGPQSADAGRQLFMRHCARCHGADAKGGKGPALAGRSLNQDEIEEMVSAGQPSKMPSFKKQLSGAEIKTVAAYVRSLAGRS